MSWLKKPTPQEQLEARLLAMARAARLETWLSNLPLEFLLRHQCRHSEATAAANPAKMDSSQDRLRLLRLIRTKTPNANGTPERLKNWLIRRPCLQRLRTAFIQFRRRLMVRALCLALRLLMKRSRGTPPTFGPCSMNSSSKPNNPESTAVEAGPPPWVCQTELLRRLPQERFIPRPQRPPWPEVDPMARRN